MHCWEKKSWAKNDTSDKRNSCGLYLQYLVLAWKSVLCVIWSPVHFVSETLLVFSHFVARFPSSWVVSNISSVHIFSPFHSSMFCPLVLLLSPSCLLSWKSSFHALSSWWFLFLQLRISLLPYPANQAIQSS